VTISALPVQRFSDERRSGNTCVPHDARTVYQGYELLIAAERLGP